MYEIYKEIVRPAHARRLSKDRGNVMGQLITVFTPTYNRKEKIVRCYESLRAQTSHDFEWVVIDDGSTDGTGDLVKAWQEEEHDFPIRYFYQEHGGVHVAYNRAVKEADSEIFLGIDSDDWMPKDAIERMADIWNTIRDKGYSGIIALDSFEDGSCVGVPYPEGVTEIYLYENFVKYKNVGDKKIIQKTEYLKQADPVPISPGETHCDPSYVMCQMDRFGKTFVVNESVCIVEYQEDGISHNIFRHYKNSPNGFRILRKMFLSFPERTFFFTLRQYVHYNSSCILGKKIGIGLKEAPSKCMAIFTWPFGLLLALLILYKTRK